MISTKIIRTTLWLSVPFNFIGAGLLFFSGSVLSQLFGLPAEVPLFYSATLCFIISLFGLVYGWLALQDEILAPLLVVGAIGKAAVFVIALIGCFLGDVAPQFVALTSADMAFALLWFAWLLGRA
ncbi:MAG: hypothetical protein ACSHXK_10810 [Oceanococcus sp.]